MGIIYEIPRGDDYQILYTVISGATGLPVDITGCTIWWTAKTATTVADPGTFQRKTGGSGITIATPQTGSTKGQFTVALVPANTSGLGDGITDLVFDCQIKDTAGEVYTLETGILRVRADVTISTV